MDPSSNFYNYRTALRGATQRSITANSSREKVRPPVPKMIHQLAVWPHLVLHIYRGRSFLSSAPSWMHCAGLEWGVTIKFTRWHLKWGLLNKGWNSSKVTVSRKSGRVLDEWVFSAKKWNMSSVGRHPAAGIYINHTSLSVCTPDFGVCFVHLAESLIQSHLWWITGVRRCLTKHHLTAAVTFQFQNKHPDHKTNTKQSVSDTLCWLLFCKKLRWLSHALYRHVLQQQTGRKQLMWRESRKTNGSVAACCVLLLSGRCVPIVFTTSASGLSSGQKLHNRVAQRRGAQVELEVGQDMRRVLVSSSSNMLWRRKKTWPPARSHSVLCCFLSCPLWPNLDQCGARGLPGISG